MPYMPTKITGVGNALFEKTISNANRLLRDSILLLENDRGQSALVLGVFALEELGKALITHWNVRNEGSKRQQPSHVEKQSATFALLCAKEVSNNPDRLVKYKDRGKLNFLKFGPYSHQFAWARAGFYDDLRMIATYDDKNPRIPKELLSGSESDLAKELNEYFHQALVASGDANAMKLASEIYRNGLGRL